MRLFRWIIFGFMVMMLVACNSTPSSADPSRTKIQSEKQTIEIFKQSLKQQMNQEQYSFILKIQNNKTFEELQGMQSADNWELKIKGNDKFEIAKNGKQITIQSQGKKEVLTEEQAGLISPKDHLELVHELAQEYKVAPNTTGKSQDLIQLEVTLNQEKLEEKLQSRLNTPKTKGFVLPLSGQVQVKYFFRFHPTAKKIKMFEVWITSNETNESQTVFYTF